MDSWRDRREFFIDNLLVRIHFIIVMIRWTGLAPWSLSSGQAQVASMKDRMDSWRAKMRSSQPVRYPSFFFFITLKPRVE